MKSNKVTNRLFLLKTVLLLVIGILFGMGCSQHQAQAASKYKIKINKQANCVTIYKTDSSGTYQPVKAMICSTGAATKLGTYSLGEKLRWHELMGPCYGQYCTRIYGGVLFHSVWYSGYNNPSTLSISSYNKLGTTASHGCVRLTVADAKWIYDNVPSGSQVVIYSSSNPGPLGRPKAIKLPYTYGWDPTDTGNPNNPWNNKKPSITGVKDQTVAYNSTFNIMKGITAKNTTGFDAKSLLTTEITYRGKKVSKVDTTVPGTYKIKYSLVDEIGRKASAKAKIKVTAPLAKPVISGAKNVYVTSKSKLTKNFLLKGVTVKQSGKKLAAKYVKIEKKKLKAKVFRITYTAQNASLPAVVKVKAYIDTNAPVISGVTDGATYQADTSAVIDKSYAAGLIQKVSDNYTKVSISDVVIKITEQEQGKKYRIVYTLKDEAGNKRKVTVYVVKAEPEESITIEGADSLELTAEDLGCDDNASSTQIKNALTVYLLQNAGYKATTSSGEDVTLQLVVVLTEKENREYQAVLFVEDENGKQLASKTVMIKIEQKENAE